MDWLYNVMCVFTVSTIRRHEEEAKQFLGERLYCDLDQMIFDLMDRGRHLHGLFTGHVDSM